MFRHRPHPPYHLQKPGCCHLMPTNQPWQVDCVWRCFTFSNVCLYSMHSHHSSLLPWSSLHHEGHRHLLHAMTPPPAVFPPVEQKAIIILLPQISDVVTLFLLLPWPSSCIDCSHHCRHYFSSSFHCSRYSYCVARSAHCTKVYLWVSSFSFFFYHIVSFSLNIESAHTFVLSPYHGHVACGSSSNGQAWCRHGLLCVHKMASPSWFSTIMPHMQNGLVWFCVLLSFWNQHDMGICH
jgi:hypothetical protein